MYSEEKQETVYTIYVCMLQNMHFYESGTILCAVMGLYLW